MKISEKRELKRSKYVSRGDSADYIGKQCGFCCEYSFVVNRGDDSYRYCERLRMRVGEYDSCKYYKDNAEHDKNLIELAKLLSE